jgi:hypothetical protein
MPSAACKERMEPDHRDAVEEVRAHLVSIRGGAPFLSPADAWQLLEWLDAGVSVVAIARAVERAAAARRARRARTPLGLAHARRYLDRTPAPSRPPDQTRLADRVADIAPNDPAIGRLADQLRALPASDTEALAREAVRAIRALLDDAWVSLTADARDRLLAEARAGYGDLLADLTDAVQLALVEEAARDAARAAWPGLGAELVWETLHLMPLETP